MQDFQEEILKKKLERQLSISKSVETEFSKAYSTVEDAIERGVLPEFILEKGKKAEIGTIRDWGGHKYQKTLRGWKLVERKGEKFIDPEEKEDKKEEDDGGYKGSEAYKSVVNNNDLDQLKNRRRYTEMAIEYHKKNKDEKNQKFFEAELSLIDSKIKKLSKKN